MPESILLFSWQDRDGRDRITHRNIRLEGREIRMLTGWPGVGSSTDVIETLEVAHLQEALRPLVERGEMPTFPEMADRELTCPYHEKMYDQDAMEHLRLPGDKPLRPHAKELQALIAYFLMPPTAEQLGQELADKVRAGSLDPDAFYPLAVPPPLPNPECLGEAFASRPGWVLARFRDRYA